MASSEAGAAALRTVAVVLAVLLGLGAAVVLNDADADDQPAVAQITADTSPLPPIDPATGGDLDGAIIGRLSNHVSDATAVFPFDHHIAGWAQPDPALLTAPADGWYLVGADITTLGTNYGGPPNHYTQLSVVKNWDGTSPHLHATVAFENYYAPTGTGAHGNSLAQPVWLEAGDELGLLVFGDGPILVESNPSDGTEAGFLADDGPSTLSPRFYLLPL